MALVGCSGEGNDTADSNPYRGSYAADTEDGPQRLSVQRNGLLSATFVYTRDSSQFNARGTVQPDGTFTGTLQINDPRIEERNEPSTGTLELNGENLLFTITSTWQSSQTTRYYRLRRE